MKRTKTIIFLVISLFFIALFFIFFVVQKRAVLKYPICFGPNCYSVELARTPEERQRGLMLRSSLAKEEGMLFVFEEEGSYSFWMEDTLIPLDMIWIGKDRKISYIAFDVQPCGSAPCPLVSPLAVAQYVLEINAGEAKHIGLKVGDEVTLPQW